MTDLQKAVQASIDSDYHFFDEETMVYWKTEMYEPLKMGRFFITSEENFDGTKRLFSIREFQDRYTRVNTIAFQKFETYEDAKDFILEYLTP